jgi:hypothetical protein
MQKLFDFVMSLLNVPKKSIEKVVKDKTEKKYTKDHLGHVSKYFESGRSGPGTISSGKGDPGGVSYGCHQLASKTGTLQAYLKRSVFAPEFAGLKPATGKFNAKWKEIAKKYPDKFALDQLAFITKTHYQSVRGYANGLSIPHSQAINEALFSMGVQHGRAKSVIKHAKIESGDTEIDIVNKLYDSRERYVRRIKLPPGTKRSVLNRYKRERKMVLKLCK